jgi:molecular chaperone HtpG
MASTYRMEIDFDGLMRLIGGHLYSDKRVFIREMIQNAHDSIVRRGATDPSFSGRIDIETAPLERRISFQDNGIGMNEADVRSYLSVVAASATRQAKHFAHVPGLIGQHGIGFLSAFVVADRVVVTTRRVGEQAAWRWENKGGIDYTLDQTTLAFEGSRVDIILRETESEDLVRAETAHMIIREYADFLSVPIRLNGDGPINTVVLPWERQYASDAERRFDIRTFIQRNQRDDALSVIPFRILPTENEYNISASGVLYFTTWRVIAAEPPRDVRLYQNRMLLSRRAEDLLPEWATFINGIINSDSVEPNAARDNFVQNQSARELRKLLGNLVIAHLEGLSKDDPETLKKITDFHSLGLMSACDIYPELLERIFHLIPWRTNPLESVTNDDLIDDTSEDDAGSVSRSLPKILDMMATLRPNAPEKVYVISDRMAAAQFFEMATASKIVVIDASLPFAMETLRQIEGFGSREELGHRRIQLVELDKEGARDIFIPASGDDYRAQIDLARLMDKQIVSGTSPLSVHAVRTKPDTVVAILRSSGALADRLREAERVISDARRDNTSKALARQVIELNRGRDQQLLLNADNPVIRKVARGYAACEGDSLRLNGLQREQFLEVALALYDIALLNSRNVISRDGQSRVGSQVATLVERLMEAVAKQSDLELALSTTRADLARTRPARRPDKEGVELFYITPYRDEFARIQHAVRAVVEDRWGCRLRLANTNYSEDSLVENLRIHIERADAFVVDLSDFNRNVLIEYGAVLFDDRDRPIISIMRDAIRADDMPADLRGLLHADPYGGIEPDKLPAFIAREFERFDRLKPLIERAAKAKVVSPGRLADMLPMLRQGDGLFEALARQFPTEQQWRTATPDAVAAVLPKAMSAFASAVLSSVQEGLSRDSS